MATARSIRSGIDQLASVDWDRRLFDSLIPLPEGTSYNAYLVRGSERTVLVDTTDPSKWELLSTQLEVCPRVDLVVVQHVEQDHSGCLPLVLARYPEARVLASSRGKAMLVDHLHVDERRIDAVADGETIAIGGKTLRFVHTPWVHWPETMCTFAVEDRVLFTCDFFGSHLATSDLFADERRVLEPAKRYFAEIMMPFAKHVVKNLDKLAPLGAELLCPSHGPIHAKPEPIQRAYREWAAGAPRNLAAIAYVSMHGSTLRLVERLTDALVTRGVSVERFDLAATDLGRLAVTLVDAATVVLGTPTVLAGPHPTVAAAAILASALGGKARFASVVGSYGWGGKTVEKLAALLEPLKLEHLEAVMCKGLPRQADLEAVDRLAAAIAARHEGLAPAGGKEVRPG
jgi:flavorubredoxin